MSDLEREFDKLCVTVHNCRLCDRMKLSQRVLNRSVGNLEAEIMFIGEAPGRLGADDSGVPFHGDKAGHNFEELLDFAGINRTDIFVTNAVLCNPKDQKGNNSTPTNQELENCSSYLKHQIELVNPRIIVTLGANALNATSLVEFHNLTLKGNVRTSNKWFKRILIPLYHPGQRAMIHRSMANQRSDYKFVFDTYRTVTKTYKEVNGKTGIDISLIVEYILSKKTSLTYFALHKLFYLLEYKCVQKYGRRLTKAYIIRQKDGPYCTDLNLFKLKKSIPDLQSRNLSKTNILLFKSSNGLFQETLLDEYHLEDFIIDLIDEVLIEHGDKSNAGLKKTAYFTRPMRNILYKEMEEKISLYNAPINFN